MSERLIDELKQQIGEGDAVVVVGAGVSIGATNRHPCASWTGLLHDGVNRCVELGSLKKGLAKSIHEHIDSGDLDLLLAAAETVATKLGAPEGAEYSRWLRETVGALRVESREVIEAIHGLGCTLATTNYDGLIEEVTGLPPVTWLNRAEVARVLRGADPGVLHLHGFWKSPESVVLGVRSYEKVIGDQHAQAVLRALQFMKTLVFVGCGEGLSDPNFGALLEWTGQVFAGDEYRRFRLCLDGEIEALRAKHPAGERLFPIGFGEDHSALAGFLRSLGSNNFRPASSAPSPAAARAAAFLPPSPNCFGRDEELTDLVANLIADKPEPAPILGPPGIGKSTLTLAALHDPRVAARFGARRWFIRCDGLESRSQLAAAIARAVDLQPAPDIEPAVLNALASAPAALALDNAETPWEADTLQVEELMGLLSDVPGLALIVSLRGSQRPGAVGWREPFRPQPLKLPAAREAFLAIAGRQFEADGHVDELLNAVDCVPLAITLLAYQAEGEPDLEALLRRWEKERTEMLQRAGGRERLTNLELSYELSLKSPRMTEDALRLLRMLARLPNGLALIDLDAVMPVGGDIAASVLRKSGLVLDEAGRLRLLAPLREYIRRKYSPPDEDLDRLVLHFAGLASSLADQVGGEGGAKAIQRLSPEASNIETMILFGLDKSASALCVRAAIAWGEFVRFSGAGSAQPTEHAASMAQRNDDLVSCADCIKSLGNIALARSDHEGAKSRYEEALPLYRRVGSVLGEANCIKSLGDIALRRSDHEGAKSRYEEALPLYRRVGSVLGEANCILSLGDIALERSDPTTARTSFEAALQLYQRIPEPYSIGWMHLRLARLAAEDADRRYHIEEARAAWQRINRDDLIRALNAEFDKVLDPNQ